MPFSITQVFVVCVSAVGLVITAVLVIDQRWSKYQMDKWRKGLQQFRLNHQNHAYDALKDPQSKTIRLVELMPASSEDNDIHIKFSIVSLLDTQRQRYEAISYCWGDQTVPFPISCSDNSFLWVTENLYGALARLRLRVKSRFLWADAICINQADNDEKSWQVKMMGDIYRNADRVLIWLGEEADSSGILDEFIPRLLKAMELKIAAQDTRPCFKLRSAEIRAYGIPSLGPRWEGYVALFRMAQRPWFERIWIVQEVALAREAIVICGHWAMPWSSLEKAWNFATYDLDELGALATFSKSLTGYYIGVLTTTIEQVSAEAQVSFLHLLSWHSWAQASDPRDRVFALRGISKNAEGIEIDYTKSMMDVFRDTVLFIMTKDHNLDILSLAAIRLESSDGSIPSWVPDWRSREHAVPMVLSNMPWDFKATMRSTYTPIPSPDRLRIKLFGYVLDSVSIVGPSATPFRVSPRIWKYFHNDWTWAEWAKICEAFVGKKYQLTGETSMDVFKRTLLLGSPLDRVAFQHYDSKNESNFRWFSSRIQITGFVGGPLKLHLWLPTKVLFTLQAFLFFFHLVAIVTLRIMGESQWATLVAFFSSGRRMIKTDRGYIGLSSGNVKVGDKVILLEGGNVPYVIRETNETNVYILTGDTYLHGFMYGRGWEPERCQALWLV